MALNGGKKGLDPLVECSEAVDTHDTPSQQQEAASSLLPENPLDASTSKSTETVPTNNGKTKNEGKRRRMGSRLSLASLFSFSSQGGSRENKENGNNRERSRSRWSCGEGEPPEAVMSSISIGDLRSTGRSTGSHAAASGSNRRYRGGSDAGGGPCAEERGVASREEAESADPLLMEESDQEGETETAGAVAGRKSRGGRGLGKSRECPLCCMRQPASNFPRLVGCSHRSCRLCLMQYVEMEIMENRVEVSCPECPNHLHPADIKRLVGGRSCLIEKYEQFSLRRYLLTEPDARWCPAPDCGYAVIAASCAACPQLKCPRDSCGALFCYHCKGAWHANQTCDEARRLRGGPTATSFRPNGGGRRITNSSIDAQLRPGDIKACPKCHTYIVKMDDGSCNHMVCAMCSAEFCWLCLKEISDLHYLSPTGCTFWGKKPWTRKKKLLWQVGTLIGAPVGIALIAGLSIPGIIFGVPVFVGRKVHQRFLHFSKARRRLVTAACVAGSLVVSPVLAVMAVGVGVPIMLAYVYGVVPLSLCRNGGCGLSESGSSPHQNEVDEEELWREAAGLEKSQLLGDGEPQLDSTSIAPGISMQSGSISANHARLSVHNYSSKRARSPSISSGSGGRLSPEVRTNYEEASTKAMAGSHYHFYGDDKSVHTMCSGHDVVSYSEEVASTKALAGSVHDSKSLSDSTGRHRHDTNIDQKGVEEQSHVAIFATPSTSSAEHIKWQMDENASAATAAIRRRLETRAASTAPRPSCVAAAGNMPGGQAGTSTADSHMDEVSPTLDGFDVEAQLPRSSRSGTTIGPTGLGSAHQDTRDEADPFKIRALLDNMKQMVAADVPQERAYEPSSSRSVAVSSRIRHSGSGKSLATVGTTHSSSATDTQLMGPDPVASSPPVVSSSKEKRGFFSALFGRKKK